jgi:hypothetical protein
MNIPNLHKHTLSVHVLLLFSIQYRQIFSDILLMQPVRENCWEQKSPLPILGPLGYPGFIVNSLCILWQIKPSNLQTPRKVEFMATVTILCLHS